MCFFSSRRRHTRWPRDWSSDVCSSDLAGIEDIALAGLAKRLEEVWVPDSPDPVILPRTSEALYLLQRIRDEAHRFAIAHHRTRRSKALTSSVLDDIPGLGPARRKALLRGLGSVKKIRAASVEEIQTVPGIGPSLAATIVETLHGTDTSTARVAGTTEETMDDSIRNTGNNTTEDA